MPHSPRFEFGPFQLDLNDRLLTRAGEVISLEIGDRGARAARQMFTTLAESCAKLTKFVLKFGEES
jgi:hypothetical protein